jgi:hypothetical protein
MFMDGMMMNQSDIHVGETIAKSAVKILNSIY